MLANALRKDNIVSMVWEHLDGVGVLLLDSMGVGGFGLSSKSTVGAVRDRFEVTGRSMAVLQASGLDCSIYTACAGLMITEWLLFFGPNRFV